VLLWLDEPHQFSDTKIPPYIDQRVFFCAGTVGKAPAARSNCYVVFRMVPSILIFYLCTAFQETMTSISQETALATPYLLYVW
jgi:hypothetical protein